MSHVRVLEEVPRVIDQIKNYQGKSTVVVFSWFFKEESTAKIWWENTSGEFYLGKSTAEVYQVSLLLKFSRESYCQNLPCNPTANVCWGKPTTKVYWRIYYIDFAKGSTTEICWGDLMPRFTKRSYRWDLLKKSNAKILLDNLLSSFAEESITKILLRNSTAEILLFRVP